MMMTMMMMIYISRHKTLVN